MMFDAGISVTFRKIVINHRETITETYFEAYLEDLIH